MKPNLRPLTQNQLRTLKRVASDNDGWVDRQGEYVRCFGSTQHAEWMALERRGLLEQRPRRGPEDLGYWFRVTELGQQVLCGEAFARGLAVGYAGWCAELERTVETDRLMAEEQQRHDEVDAGLRYPSYEEKRADALVREVIWKNVRVTP